MNRIIYSPEAKEDLENIVGYIHQFNPKAAAETYNNILKTIDILKEFKESGVVKADITDKPLRFLYFDKYVIGYNPNTEPVEIVRILSGEMDLFDGDFF